MTPSSHREQLEELISASIEDFLFSEFTGSPTWDASWKGQFQKPLRLQLVFSDMEITVCHDMDPEFSASFRLECTLGPLEASRKEQVFRVLLEENLGFDPSFSRGFGWDEARKQIVFCMTCPVAAPDPRSLTDVLINLAVHAKHWRDTLVAPADADLAMLAAS